jgi:hypothetical protein
MRRVSGQIPSLRTTKGLLIWVVLAFFLFSFVSQSILFANAADLRQRSITIGSSLASEVTNHEMRFTTATSGSIGSVVYEYCTNLPYFGTPCTAPAGLIVNGASIASQSGISGLSISGVHTTTNRLVLTRTPGVVGLVAYTANFSNITNQSTPNESVFVRIGTYSSTDGSGLPIDFGAVVYSTADGVGVGGYVPPFLTFCAGVTVALDCSTTAGELINMGELSTSNTNTGTSQFAGATNDLSGYSVYVSGGTMTAGNEIIPALVTNGSSNPGTSQFGINLRSNSTPSVGAEVSGGGTAVPNAGYGTSNSFRYNDGELIAQSPLPTEYNRFTVSYIVNVSEDQAPGIYASSYTYTAIASF